MHKAGSLGIEFLPRETEQKEEATSCAQTSPSDRLHDQQDRFFEHRYTVAQGRSMVDAGESI